MLFLISNKIKIINKLIKSKNINTINAHTNINKLTIFNTSIRINIKLFTAYKEKISSNNG